MISGHEKYSKPPVVYRAEDAVDKFLECLQEEQKYIQEQLDFIEPMRIERAEEQAFQDAVVIFADLNWELIVFVTIVI